MSAKKAFAIGVIVAVLGIQLVLNIPVRGFGGTWYWPFTDFTMYAGRMAFGDTLTVHRLRVTPCDGAAEARLATSEELRIWSRRLAGRLGRIAALEPGEAAGKAQESALVDLDDRLQRYLGDGACSAEVWAKSAVLSRDPSGVREATWRPVLVWDVGQPLRFRQPGSR